MNLFDVHALSYVLHEIAQAEMAFTMFRVTGHGNKPPVGVQLQRAKQALKFAESFFYVHPVGPCAEAVALAKQQWERPLIDNSAACEIFHRLQADLVSALKSKVFLKVANDRSEFVDRERLFGDGVYDAFRSANIDIKEAGNCLAAECNTAAVFHLMRAAEVALRGLARDRNIEFAEKPLEQKEWGQILDKLDATVKAMRLEPSSQWTKPELKEQQVRFYAEVAQETAVF